jgi:hypothetical protein
VAWRGLKPGLLQDCHRSISKRNRIFSSAVTVETLDPPHRPGCEKQQSKQVVEDDDTATLRQLPSLHAGRYTGYRLTSLIQDLNCSECIIVRPNDE